MVLGFGLLILYGVCLHPSLRLLLYGDDYCLIQLGVKTMEAGPGRLLDPLTYRNFFRPLLFAVYYLSYRAFGLNELYYHLLLIVIHVLNALLLWRLIHATAQPRSGWSRALGLLWTCYFFSQFRVHQAVYWFCGIKQLLSVLWGLMALWGLLRLIRGGSRAWLALALVMAILGLGTVESYLGFVAALGMIALWWPRPKGAGRGRLASSLGFFLLAAAYLSMFAIIRFWVAPGQQVEVFTKPLLHYPAHTGLFMIRAAVPVFLDPEGLHNLEKILITLAPLLILLFTLGLGAMAIKCWPRGFILFSQYLLLIIPFVVAYGPSLEGDRIYYEPVAAMCLGLGYGTVRLVDRKGPGKALGPALIAAALLVLIAGNLRCYRQVTIPAYARVDAWNREVQGFLVTYFSSHRKPFPVGVYWIGFPEYLERVMAGPTCIDKMINLHLGETVVSGFKSPVYRTPGPGRELFSPSPFHLGPPQRSDLVIFDNGHRLEIISADQALRLLEQLAPGPGE